MRVHLGGPMAVKPRPAAAEDDRKSEPVRPTRRPYAAPVLTEYGSIGKLTRSGSGAVGEGSGMSMPMCL